MSYDRDELLFYGTTAGEDCINLTFITPISWNYELMNVFTPHDDILWDF